MMNEHRIAATAIGIGLVRVRARAPRAELEARREAEAASRAKDQFLATLSHELRTPLSPVLTWSELLRRRPASPEDTERGLAAISRNATNLARLIDELLDVSRIESGKLRLEPMPIDLGRVIVEAVDVIHSAAEAKRITIETVSDPAGCRVLGDPTACVILWNLLSNAIVHVGERHGAHHARTPWAARARRRDRYRPGHSSRALPFVFERFRQVTRPRRDSMAGSASASRSCASWSSCTVAGSMSTAAKGAARRSRWSYRCWSPTTRSNTPRRRAPTSRRSTACAS
jgi:signal transduction histidine kinase